MIEIFLFVNPIGVACFKNEQAIIDAIKKTERDVKFHYVPIANLESVRLDLVRQGIINPDLDTHNKNAQKIYNSLLDYHSISFMGERKGREFLYRLQVELHQRQREYSAELTAEILETMKINPKVFQKNRESKYCQEAIDADLHLAQEFDITYTPTTIIYDYDSDDNCGVMVQGCFDSDIIDQVLADEMDFQDAVDNIKKSNTLKVL